MAGLTVTTLAAGDTNMVMAIAGPEGIVTVISGHVVGTMATTPNVKHRKPAITDMLNSFRHRLRSIA